MVQEERNHVAVSGGVREAEPHLALRIEGSDHGNPRQDRVELAVTLAISLGPYSPDEARLIKPRLVDVDDPLALFKPW